MLTIVEFRKKLNVFYMFEREILLLLFKFYYYFHGFIFINTFFLFKGIPQTLNYKPKSIRKNTFYTLLSFLSLLSCKVFNVNQSLFPLGDFHFRRC